jgi:predicted XRE-type DNA-binding protein
MGLNNYKIHAIINYTISAIYFKMRKTRWKLMLKNNIEVDVKVKCIEADTTQAKLAENIGTTPSYVNRLIKNKENIVNKNFIQMLESLGYDIELKYVKRD